ncbi:MAG: type II toxin-antitoxin system VapB family antitoxin [Oceanipulchritudo sp.]
MRITVDIERSTLAELQRITGKGKKSPAVAEAVNEYVKRHKARELGRLLREGAVDYPVTNEEIEEQDR